MTVADINKSDGICDACDGFDPSCGASRVTVSGQLRTLRCIEALQELVRLKDIKQRIEVLQAEPEHRRSISWENELRGNQAMYNACKDAAWNAAREALKD